MYRNDWTQVAAFSRSWIMSTSQTRLSLEPIRWATRVGAELATGEDQGYFGPASTIWSIHQETVVSLGLTRALLMQLAHPWVAQAVSDHSTFDAQPLDRLLATAAAAEFLVFGSRSQADAMAARIRQIHTRINGELTEDVGRWHAGTRYSAEDPDALLWVLATLMDTTLVMYDLFFGQLPAPQERSYLREASRIGEILGVRPGATPTTRPELDVYIAQQIEDGTVAVSQVAAHIGRQMIELRYPSSLGRLIGAYRYLALGYAASTMPADLARQYELPISRLHLMVCRTIARGSRIVLPRVPAHLRTDPVARNAQRRAERMPVQPSA
jgi:uncharacterized protein (DUF2236 family)